MRCFLENCNHHINLPRTISRKPSKSICNEALQTSASLEVLRSHVPHKICSIVHCILRNKTDKKSVKQDRSLVRHGVYNLDPSGVRMRSRSLHHCAIVICMCIDAYCVQKRHMIMVEKQNQATRHADVCDKNIQIKGVAQAPQGECCSSWRYICIYTSTWYLYL